MINQGRYGPKDPRVTRPTWQDKVAYATTIAEIPVDLGLTGPDAAQRTLNAARIAKLLAYAIPDLGQLQQIESKLITIRVVTQPGVNVAPYIRDPDLVARLLNWDGEFSFDLSSHNPQEPPSVVLFLLPSLTETHPDVALAIESECLVIGLSGNRLIAGLQGLFLQFYGCGHCFPVECTLGGAADPVNDPLATMRHGWALGWPKAPLNSHALINLEGQVDEMDAGDLNNPLAGSVVRIGEQVLYVGAGGRSACLKTGKLALCRAIGPQRYDVALLEPQVFKADLTPFPILSMGCAADLHLQQAIRSGYGYQRPAWKDGIIVETNQPALTLDHEFQCGRHIIFNHDDDDD